MFGEPETVDLCARRNRVAPAAACAAATCLAVRDPQVVAFIVAFATRVVRRSREAAGNSEQTLQLLPRCAEARAAAFVSVKSLAGLAQRLRRTRRRGRRQRRTHWRGRWRRRRAARVAEAAGGAAEPILDVVGVLAPAAAAVLLRRDGDVAHLGLPLGARVQPQPPRKAGRRLDVDAVLRARRWVRWRVRRRRSGRAHRAAGGPVNVGAARAARRRRRRRGRVVRRHLRTRAHEASLGEGPRRQRRVSVPPRRLRGRRRGGSQAEVGVEAPLGVPVEDRRVEDDVAWVGARHPRVRVWLVRRHVVERVADGRAVGLVGEALGRAVARTPRDILLLPRESHHRRWRDRHHVDRGARTGRIPEASCEAALQRGVARLARAVCLAGRRDGVADLLRRVERGAIDTLALKRAAGVRRARLEGVRRVLRVIHLEHFLGLLGVAVHCAGGVGERLVVGDDVDVEAVAVAAPHPVHDRAARAAEVARELKARRVELQRVMVVVAKLVHRLDPRVLWVVVGGRLVVVLFALRVAARCPLYSAGRPWSSRGLSTRRPRVAPSSLCRWVSAAPCPRSQGRRSRCTSSPLLCCPHIPHAPCPTASRTAVVGAPPRARCSGSPVAGPRCVRRASPPPPRRAARRKNRSPGGPSSTRSETAGRG
eukprot:scaffold123514_cov63-Phaeocystis_antarctica.AAC.3